MKLFFALVCITSIHCSSKRESSAQIDLGKQAYDIIPKKKLVIKDESKYSKVFINSLREFISSDANVELDDSTVIFLNHPKMSMKFPVHPKKNEYYTFAANNGLAYYELTLRRINYSDIEFHVVLKEGLEVNYDSKGVAVISPGFINGAEMYEDEITNGGYPMYGYESSNENCTTLLYVSTPYAGETELKAKIKEITCGDAKVRELIEKMPTLRAKIK